MNAENGIISFDNTENAFAYKTDKELKKANFLFTFKGQKGVSLFFLFS